MSDELKELLDFLAKDLPSYHDKDTPSKSKIAHLMKEAMDSDQFLVIKGDEDFAIKMIPSTLIKWIMRLIGVALTKVEKDDDEGKGLEESTIIINHLQEFLHNCRKQKLKYSLAATKYPNSIEEVRGFLESRGYKITQAYTLSKESPKPWKSSPMTAGELSDFVVKLLEEEIK